LFFPWSFVRLAIAVHVEQNLDLIADPLRQWRNLLVEMSQTLSKVLEHPPRNASLVFCFPIFGRRLF